MATDNGEQKATLEERKARLESELEEIQNELGGSWEEMKRQVKSRSKLRYWLQKFPIASVGTAFAIGMWLARDRSSSKKVGVEAPANSIRSLIATEFKHLAVQRLTRSVMNQIDDAIDNFRKERENQ